MPKIIALWTFLLVACSTPSTSPPTPSVLPDPGPPPLSTVHHRPAPDPAPMPPPVKDPRSQAQIDVAACMGADGTWRCKAKKPQTFAATGSTPILPASWTVPSWFFDPANSSGVASDQNACTTSGAPCLTWQEINVHRWGCLGNPYACPRLAQATAIEQMSASSSATDLIYLYPAIEQGSYLNFFGPLGASQQVCTGAITVTAAKSRTKGASSLLTVTLPCATTVNSLVVNASHPSSAWTFVNTSGNTFTMSQPLSRTNVPWNNADPTEVDTWTTNDTVTVYTPVTSPIVAAVTTRSQAQTNAAIYLTDINVKIPSTSSAELQIGGGTIGIEALFNSTILMNGIDMTSTSFIECDAQNSVASPAWPNSEGPPQFKGGIFHSSFLAQYSMGLEGAPIVSGTSFDMNPQLNDVYIASGTILIVSGQGFGVAYSGQAAPFIWGPGTLVVYPASSFEIGAATATPSLLVSTTKLNLATTGCSMTNAQPAVIDCNIPVDGAHIDAVAGDAGGGGFLWNPSGAYIYTTASPF